MTDQIIADRLKVFQGMLSTCHKLFLRSYDNDFYSLGNETEEERLAEELFALSRSRTELRRFLFADRTPVLFTNRVNMMWLCCPEFAGGELHRVHVLGPFFMDDFFLCRQRAGRRPERPGTAAKRREAGAKAAHSELGACAGIRADAALSDHRGEDPAVGSALFGSGSSPRECGEGSRHGYPRHLSGGAGDAAHGAGGGSLLASIYRPCGSHRYYRTTGKVGRYAAADEKHGAGLHDPFLRTAIEGGLSPETAYTLCDRYFQSVEQVKSLSELATVVAQTMHHDFVERVHAVRTQKLSKEIEAACSYIERHLEDELSIASLAAYAGYIEYYFSRKFKRELGLTPAEYIRKKRLAKAALLLRSTDLDAQQIASRLQFCSQSYFTDCFRKEYGVSPTKYRKEGKA